MRKVCVLFIVVAVVAEIAGTVWVWGRAPADTLRVWYPSFWAYFVERFVPWLMFMLLFGVLLYVWFVRKVHARGNRV